MILGLVAGSWSVPGMSAQEETTSDVLASVSDIDLPSPGRLTVFRIGLEPEAAIPMANEVPTTGLLIVESGELTVRSDAAMTVTRGGMGGAGAPEMVEIAAGAEVTLAAGVSAVIPPNTGGEVRNDGQERAEALVILIGPPQVGM